MKREDHYSDEDDDEKETKPFIQMSPRSTTKQDNHSKRAPLQSSIPMESREYDRPESLLLKHDYEDNGFHGNDFGTISL